MKKFLNDYGRSISYILLGVCFFLVAYSAKSYAAITLLIASVVFSSFAVWEYLALKKIIREQKENNK